MQLGNNHQHFGLVTIILHWLIAVLTISLFFIGVWMVELDYYDRWYQQVPWWHKGLGVVTVVLIICRWIWQLFTPVPLALASVAKWQQMVAHLVHFLMNILIIIIGLSGYLIVTAKGQALSVFDWITIPAVISGIDNLEDMSGDIHYLLAYLLMMLVALHILAALSHHFIYKDKTLQRMLGQ